jgi:DNA-binding cell septation regulator SpoVG
MRVVLLSLNPPDSKHPPAVQAVASIQLDLDSGESIVIADFRVIKGTGRAPDYVVPPARWSDNRREPIFVATRRTLRQIEDLIMAAYEQSQLARLDANSGADAASTAGAQ